MRENYLISILRSGYVDEFNKLRPVVLDLRWNDLSGMQLPGINLCGADLRRVNLSGTDLRGANLRGAFLDQSNMQDCDMREADLTGAIFQGADLRNSDLRAACLRDARFDGATLAEVKLAGAAYVPPGLNCTCGKACKRKQASLSECSSEALEILEDAYA